MFEGDNKQTFLSLSMIFTTQAYWKYTRLWLHFCRTAKTNTCKYNWLQFLAEMNTSGSKHQQFYFLFFYTNYDYKGRLLRLS